jgi:hypothetical protein
MTISLIQDQTCLKIAKLLQTDINNIGSRFYSMNLVRTIRSFYDYKVPLTELPTLMVFRTTDLFTNNTDLIGTSNLQINYCMAYEDSAKITPYCHLIARIINSSLNKISVDDNINVDIISLRRRADYSPMSITQSVYSFLQFYCEMKESSIPEDILKILNGQNTINSQIY